MRQRATLGAALIAAVFAVVAPVSLSGYLARVQAIQQESSLAMAYAEDVLHRSEETADQIDAGLKTLSAMGEEPCSQANIDLMHKIQLGAPYIKVIGHVEGERMTCSSIGDGATIELGPVSAYQPNGVRLREGVRLPAAPGTPFLVIERDGYAGFVHPDAPTDLIDETPGLSIATLSGPNREVLYARGVIDPGWIAKLGSAKRITFVDGDHVVAVATSSRYHFGTITSLPISDLDERIRADAAITVPVGIIVGAILAFLIVRVAKTQLAMPALIKAAIRRHEFFLIYQPSVDLKTGRYTGAEALIRWKRPSGDLVRPDVFIPIAEQSGLIRQLTEEVIALVGKDAQDLFQRYPDFHIAINLSSADLHAEETVGHLQALRERLGAAGRNLVVEVTERGFTDPDLASRNIGKIRDLGIKVAIDDFGTGYSSLSYLEKLSLDYLKIDKSFVDTIETEAATSQVILHIIAMAKSLKLEMIAEGVETENQARFLRERGVEYAQGYFYSKPVPFSDLIAQLETVRPSGQAESPSASV